MPIYEYRCQKGHSFDVLQSMSDDPLTACEVCGAPVQKVLHAPAVHFKGSGFYSTDYGKKKAAGAASGSGSGSGDGDSGGGDKNDKAKSNGSSDKKSEPKKPEATSSSE
jgi:putative FmdB family regulatory protein